jgi:hypothetical protein
MSKDRLLNRALRGLAIVSLVAAGCTPEPGSSTAIQTAGQRELQKAASTPDNRWEYDGVNPDRFIKRIRGNVVSVTKNHPNHLDVNIALYEGGNTTESLRVGTNEVYESCRNQAPIIYPVTTGHYTGPSWERVIVRDDSCFPPNS